MNNKAFYRSGLFQYILLLLILVACAFVVVLIVTPLTIPFLNSGSSVDIAYGLENNAFWHKLYLKDDHKTIYCIDKEDNDLIELAKRAARDKIKVEVYYQEYIFRGSLCTFNTNDKYNSVVVTKMEIVE